MNETDEQIVKKVISGDLDAYGVLVDRYTLKLKRYAQRFLFDFDDREDLVQEVFLKSYVNLQGFDSGRKFSPWIYRIAHNEFVNALKRRERIPVILPDPEIVFPNLIAPETANDWSEKNEARAFIDKVVTTLEAKYREILILYYFEDLSYGEISDVLHIPISTVGVRLNRGRVAVKKTIARLYPNYIYEE